MSYFTKLSHEEKRGIRRYRKAQKKYEKQLIRYIKEEEKPYDWFSIVEILIKMIKRRLDYYSCGDNVWQTDETRDPTVETLKTAYRLGMEAVARDDMTPDMNGWTTEDFIVNEKEIQEAYVKFFSYIAANMRSWWD